VSHCFRVVAAVDRRNSSGVAAETGAADGVVAGIGLTICETVSIVPRIAAFRILMDVAVVCVVWTSNFCRWSADQRLGGSPRRRFAPKVRATERALAGRSQGLCPQAAAMRLKLRAAGRKPPVTFRTEGARDGEGVGGTLAGPLPAGCRHAAEVASGWAEAPGDVSH